MTMVARCVRRRDSQPLVARRDRKLPGEPIGADANVDEPRPGDLRRFADLGPGGLGAQFCHEGRRHVARGFPSRFASGMAQFA